MSLLGLAIGLSGCGDADSEPAPQQAERGPLDPVEAEAGPNNTGPRENDPALCERDAAGQTACLVRAFKLERCDQAAVLGSMFRENAEEGTHTHRTAFGVDSACLAELRAAAPKRRLRENEEGAFVLDSQAGYGETLIIGLQISEDGSVVEWERTKQ